MIFNTYYNNELYKLKLSLQLSINYLKVKNINTAEISIFKSFMVNCIKSDMKRKKLIFNYNRWKK
jgi:hypothetical protein